MLEDNKEALQVSNVQEELQIPSGASKFTSVFEQRFVLIDL
jgi:hypothetical protein